MRNPALSRCVAAALAAAIAIPLFPAQAAAGAAALTGRVVVAGTGSPLAGARIHLGDKRTGRTVTSGLTKEDGAFEVAGLEPAAYELAVESNGGLYLVGSPVSLAGGEERSVQLVVSETAPAPGEKEKEEPGQKPAPTGWWNNPMTATLVVVGTAVILGIIVGNLVDNEPASPSVP